MTTNKPPLYYNLGAITRETGLHPDTLRAWERRYNLPQPTRSDGGQRLYSQRDLEIVHWLIAQQNKGLRISQAAELWHTQVDAGIDPLAETTKADPYTLTPVVEGGSLAAYRQAWIEASMDFNNVKADQVLTEAFSQFPPETVSFEVLFGGLSAIGDLWYQGKASVQQEHYASALVVRRLNALIAGAPQPNRFEKIVIAAPPEEVHVLSSLLMTYLLRRRGYDVVYLGADVPVENFRETIEELRPNLLILTAHLLVTAASMLTLVNELAGLSLRVAFGGLVFIRLPQLRENMPGKYLGDDLKQAVGVIEKVLSTSSSKLEAFHPKTPPYLEELRMKLPHIETHLTAAFDDIPLLLSAPNNYISKYLISAIKLGDLDYLHSDLEWAYGLITNFQIPGDLLVEFVNRYRQAVLDVMGESAQPLVRWLEHGAKQIENYNGRQGR
jgi:methanogenic corrinoid protein MtbC1